MKIFYTARGQSSPLETTRPSGGDHPLGLDKKFLPSQLIMLALAVGQLLNQRNSFFGTTQAFSAAPLNLLSVSLWLLLACSTVWTAAEIITSGTAVPQSGG
jgi:hypothetical protein